MTTEAGSDGRPRTSAALFGLLSDETRLQIVRVLYRDDRIRSNEPGLTFSALFERVDVDDSGRFNYHLRRLHGPLVETRGDRYVLTALGTRLGALVVDEPISGSDVEAPSR